MAGCAVNHFRMPGGRAIVLAIVGGAQVRSAFENLSTNPDLRLGRIKAGFMRASARVGDRATDLGVALLRKPTPPKDQAVFSLPRAMHSKLYMALGTLENSSRVELKAA